MPGILKPKESALEIAICHYLSTQRLFFWKSANRGYFDGKKFRRDYNPYTRKGIPDITCVFKSRFVGFEIKTPDGKLSQEQKVFKEDLEANGGAYYVLRSVDDAIAAVKDLRERAS